jgi:hypothetical protein
MAEELPGLPTDLTYGYVMGRFLLAVGNKTGDQKPDAIAAVGTLTFSPAVTQILDDSDVPTVILPQVVSCQLDSNGYLVDPLGVLGVELITGQYTVNFSFTGVTIKPLVIQVLVTNTQSAPLWISRALPIPADPTTTFVVNQQVYTDTLAARDAAIAAAASAGAPAALINDNVAAAISTYSSNKIQALLSALTPSGATVFIQNTDGSYPTVGSAVKLYAGSTPPDPSTVSGPAFFILQG